ncbi:hypothetical protein [Empedobacter sedimenti]|uniref:hypothetical protein n=1 Tax=Empedobacter sedimenti TaxID=3042610 RepID=UPI0024A77D11|nr:hypothetical protein [Empedobacter sedimenti]
MDWTPISLKELNTIIETSVAVMDTEVLSFWNSIKIVPEKRQAPTYSDNDYFWVVGKTEKYIIYYNDIEEGFNISLENNLSYIEVTSAEQDELHFSLIKLLKNYEI